MPKLIPLGGQVFLIVWVWRYADRYFLYDLKPVTFYSRAFGRVIGDKTHLLNAQVAEDLCTYAVVALVGLEAEAVVSLYGVHALFLELVGFQFIQQADTAAFLLHV